MDNKPEGKVTARVLKGYTLRLSADEYTQLTGMSSGDFVAGFLIGKMVPVYVPVEVKKPTEPQKETEIAKPANAANNKPAQS